MELRIVLISDRENTVKSVSGILSNGYDFRIYGSESAFSANIGYGDIVITDSLDRNALYFLTRPYMNYSVFIECIDSEECSPFSVEGRTVFIYDSSAFSISRALDIIEGKKKDSLDALLVGKSRCMRNLRRRISSVSRSMTGVHIEGETGTGKNIAARYIHDMIFSKRKIVYENCAELGSSIAESKLFGHSRGAFSGAMDDRQGLISKANGTTLFLDEIESLSMEMQGELLHVMETGEFRKLGKDDTSLSMFFLITASNIRLENLVEAGRMRRDFFHRLSGLRITMPPLRDHMEDIPEIVRSIENDLGIPVDNITDFSDILSYPWPGNVRELRTFVTNYHASRQIT